jgi:ferredoxin
MAEPDIYPFAQSMLQLEQCSTPIVKMPLSEAFCKKDKPIKPIKFNRKHTWTPYVQIDTKKCQACWKCIESCPKNIIGKVDLSWHKHARINNGDQCMGCLKCLKVCNSGALIKIEK